MKKLYNIRDSIYSMRSREECLTDCIKEKLNVSLYNFNQEINSICDEISVNKTLRVLKNIVKNQEKQGEPTNDINR